jgi:acyl-CoA synthetase (AMP-forming)/AMP-acid ligase II
MRPHSDKQSVGRSRRGPIHITDPETGDELAQGQEGLVCFELREPFEYHKDPQKTAGAIDARGWGGFGDIGRLDADGYLYLTDRLSHMIISGGVNIYPQEIESVLSSHPAVSDVAVIGVSDAEFGESVKAVVEPLPGVVADAALAAELIAFCRTRLAGFKCPKTVDFSTALPRHPNGKLLKRELKALYANGPASI